MTHAEAVARAAKITAKLDQAKARWSDEMWELGKTCPHFEINEFCRCAVCGLSSELVYEQCRHTRCRSTGLAGQVRCNDCGRLMGAGT